MQAGRIGGWLLLSGTVMLAIAGVLGATGQTVTFGALAGDAGVGSWLGFGGIAFAGSGSIIIGFTGPGELHGRALRFGLVLLGAGLLVLTAASILGGTMSTDPGGSAAWVGLFLGGLAGTGSGALITCVGLLVTAGRPRRLGLLFLAGLGVAVAGSYVANTALGSTNAQSPGASVLLVVAGAGLALMLAAVAGLGLLAAGARRPAIA